MGILQWEHFIFSISVILPLKVFKELIQDCIFNPSESSPVPETLFRYGISPVLSSALVREFSRQARGSYFINSLNLSQSDLPAFGNSSFISSFSFSSSSLISGFLFSISLPKKKLILYQIFWSNGEI